MPKPDDRSPGAQAEVLGIEFETGVQPAGDDSPEPRWLPAAVAGFGLAALVLLLSLSPGDPSGPEPTVPLWLVELTPEPSDEQTIRMVDLDGLAREVQEPVYFETTRWPAWAGAPLRPFITVNTNIVFPSRGEIVVAELSTGDSTTIGPGTAVVDGAVPDQFWVVGKGERWVTRHTIGDVGAGERFPFDGIGRPVAAVTGGLIVLPRLDQSVGELAVWRPDSGLTPIDTGGLDLLGAAGDVVVLGGGSRLVRYDTSDGTSIEVAIDDSLDLHQVALSPDGRTLALAQRHDVTSFGTLVIVDATSGTTLNVLNGVMNREFVWTSPGTLVTVEFENQRYRVVEVDVAEGRVSPLASIGYPWVYFAVA